MKKFLTRAGLISIGLVLGYLNGRYATPALWNHGSSKAFEAMVILWLLWGMLMTFLCIAASEVKS